MLLLSTQMVINMTKTDSVQLDEKTRADSQKVFDGLEGQND